ncbi:TonB-dependent receptor [Pedobacter sp. BAL39]|uniref:TonB-dependent receptor n=1 Tax=Pedobacter sp. BAL39 TaxID=391596 RepID=UPI0018DE8BA5|nr:TonB-dependent receptor [Pedobacter sp. BAL39]
MRINLTFILLTGVFLQASMAASGQNISLTRKGISLTEVFKEIKRQTGFDFVYRYDVIKKAKTININLKNEPLETVLDKCFEDQPLTYYVDNNTIVVRERDRATMSPGAAAADILIRGIVKDETGQPLPGAGVKVKGASTAASADVNGAFSITVPNEQTVLIISYIGYEPLEITVGSQKTLNVQLKPSGNALDEVEIAVVAFGTQKKESLVGAQSSVKASELKQPVANISSMLAGRLPGLIAVNRNGEPGSDQADIWIRGISNIGGDRNPLIIVDGVPGRPINGLSAYDIESFTILKDAAATAVYGIRGANGVILVETKRGKVGSPQINVDYFQGITTFTKKPELIDGVDYMNLANEAGLTEFVRSGTSGTFSPRYSAETINRTASNENNVLYPNVDWIDAVFRNFGQNRTATANLSGGVTNARYYVSLGYYDETGLFKTDDSQSFNSTQKFSRYNVSTNLNWDITGTTKMDLGLKGILGQGNYPGPENAQGVFNQAFQINPVSFPVTNPNGSIPGISGQGDQRNPYADVTRRGYRTTFNTQLFSNLRLTQDLKVITPGLNATGMFSFDINTSNNIDRIKRESTYYINPNDPYNADGSYKYNQTFTGQNFLGYTRSNGGDKKLYAELALNYQRDFGKHAVSGLLLYNQNDNTNAFASNFTLSIPYRLQGVAGRATYAYDNRYFAEFNIGYNGSENFAPDQRYGFFPAFGLGWIVSNEKFFEPLKNTFQLIKFRYSDGIVGSGGSTSGYTDNEANRFYYLTKVGDSNIPGYTFGQTRNVGLAGMNVTAYGVDITWSETRKQDLGFEVKTLNNTLSVIVDLFKEHRTGIFLERGLVPNYIGLVSNPSGNLGETKNKGIDGTLEYFAKFSPDFDITFRANYTYNKDQIIENDQAPTRYPWMELRGSNILASTRVGYIAEGLFTSQEEINNSPTQFGTLLPGDIKYKDLNGDGTIDAFDRTIIGRGDVPSAMYGFGFAARYRGFDLGAFFQGQHNADIILSGDAINPFTGSGQTNLHAAATDRWTVENPRQDAMFPRLSYGVNNNNFQTSTWWKRDISFLRLKNLDFGYTLNKGIPKAGIKRMRVYFTGYNVLTFSDFKLWDPEIASANGTKYPLISTYSLGFTANF